MINGEATLSKFSWPVIFSLKKILTKDQLLLSSIQITRLLEAPQKNKNLPILK